MANRFPFSGGLCSQEGEAAQFGDIVVQHKWYYGQTSSGKFWSLCDKYGSHTHKFPLFREILAPFSFWGTF